MAAGASLWLLWCWPGWTDQLHRVCQLPELEREATFWICWCPMWVFFLMWFLLCHCRQSLHFAPGVEPGVWAEKMLDVSHKIMDQGKSHQCKWWTSSKGEFHWYTSNFSSHGQWQLQEFQAPLPIWLVKLFSLKPSLSLSRHPKEDLYRGEVRWEIGPCEARWLAAAMPTECREHPTTSAETDWPCHWRSPHQFWHDQCSRRTHWVGHHM